jgi:hypothetical protein
MSPNYCKSYKFDEWKDLFDNVVEKTGENDFSIVYRFYSTRGGCVKYVGRSDSPYERFNYYSSKIGYNNMLESLDFQLSWFNFKYYIGRLRKKEVYLEECRQFHLHDDIRNSKHPARMCASWDCPYCDC